MLQMQLNVAGRPQCCGPTGPLWGSAASTQPLSALMRGASGEMQGTSRKLPDASLSSRCQLCILSSLVRDHGQPRKDFLWPRDRPLQAVGALGSAPVKVNTPAARRQPAQSSPPRWGLLGPGWGQLWGWGQGKVHLGKGCSLRERERDASRGQCPPCSISPHSSSPPGPAPSSRSVCNRGKRPGPACLPLDKQHEKSEDTRQIRPF